MPDDTELKARLRAQIAAIEGAPRPRAKDASRQVAFEPGGDTRVPGGGACTPSGEVRASRCDSAWPSLGEDRPSREDVRLRAASGGPGSRAGCRDAAGGADEAERAFRKIERLALAREQASAALRARLVREGFPPEAVDAAVGRAIACGLVDDARYAEVLVRSRLAQGRGAQGIVAELGALDIDASVVPGWPDDLAVGHDDEVERALALLDRKPPRAKNKRDAAYRRLVQKGFGASVASTAARVWSEAQ